MRLPVTALLGDLGTASVRVYRAIYCGYHSPRAEYHVQIIEALAQLLW